MLLSVFVRVSLYSGFGHRFVHTHENDNVCPNVRVIAHNHQLMYRLEHAGVTVVVVYDALQFHHDNQLHIHV